MGFTQDGDETCACSVCVLCNEVLQNNSVVSSKFKKSFLNKPGKYKDKPVSFFPLAYSMEQNPY